MKSLTVLIVDDLLENRKLLAKIITDNSDYNVLLADDGESALQIFEQKNNDENNIPDIILLDIMMPNLDGFATAKKIKTFKDYANIPIIFITALDDVDSKIKAFEVGGIDFITKPFYHREVLSRINTHIRSKLERDNLDALVKERTKEVERINLALVKALINANYYNDDETGNHIKRVAKYSEIIATALDLPLEKINEITLYAPLHDIGKVGIPHNILKKPGKLTPEEFKIMMRHSYIGYQMINDPAISETAKNIVLFHHEKWDGTGYPRRLKGDEIPIEAQIVALADVYDALRAERVYKSAFSKEQTEEIIKSSSGAHFMPQLIEVFDKVKDKFEEIYWKFKD